MAASYRDSASNVREGDAAESKRHEEEVEGRFVFISPALDGFSLEAQFRICKRQKQLHTIVELAPSIVELRPKRCRVDP